MEICIQKYKVLLQSKGKNRHPIEIWAKVLKRHFMKEYIQMTDKHMANYSISLDIRTCKKKKKTPTMRYH